MGIAAGSGTIYAISHCPTMMHGYLLCPHYRINGNQSCAGGHICLVPAIISAFWNNKFVVSIKIEKSGRVK
jgi:hypothetical protein